jgi:hypothetical protein
MRDLIEYSSFDNMKDVKSLDFFNHYNGLDIYGKESKFFSTGKIGNWRKYFSDELSEKFDQLIQEKLKYKGHIDYDD